MQGQPNILENRVQAAPIDRRWREARKRIRGKQAKGQKRQRYSAHNNKGKGFQPRARLSYHEQQPEQPQNDNPQ